MLVDHAGLMTLVLRVNGAIALVSCPFALYEALSKRADVAKLKEKLDLRADQLLAGIVAGIEEALLPFWPRSIATIIIEPTLAMQFTPGLSEAARDALTKFLRKSDQTWHRLTTVKNLARKILRFDRTLYWFIFVTAALSISNLALWAFKSDSSDFLLRSEVLGPAAMLVGSLVTAGVRQAFIQSAERQIIEE